MAEHCDHCDLPRATCAHSVPEEMRYPPPRRVNQKPLATGPTITATRDSECPACPDEILGEVSRITHTDAAGWVHEECAEPADGPPPTDPSMFDGF